VAQRRREIGVRAALGARPGQLIALTVREGLTLSVVGLLLGLSLAFWLTKYLEGLLWGIAAYDPPLKAVSV
jgi:putative ABC transport system permease protein